jgi:5-dehydro-2-deoxygluconokinase
MPDLDLLTIGRVSVDLYAEQLGAPLRDVLTFRKSIGGTATNVAVAAARLGRRVALCTRVGDDEFGSYIRYALEHTFGVDTSFVGTDPKLPTPLAFAILDPPEEPRIIFRRQPEAPDMHISVSDVSEEAIDTVKILWIAASNVAWEPSRSTMHALLTRRARRTHTVIDLDWREHFWASKAEGSQYISPLLDHATIAIGNRTECEIAVGVGDPEKAAEALLARGLTAALVKMGADGVLVATADGVREQVKPFPVKVLCGLGAGDAFGGAFCHAVLGGQSFVEAARLGNVAGAIVASRLMCADDMPTLADLHAALDSPSV